MSGKEKSSFQLSSASLPVMIHPDGKALPNTATPSRASSLLLLLPGGMFSDCVRSRQPHFHMQSYLQSSGSGSKSLAKVSGTRLRFESSRTCRRHYESGMWSVTESSGRKVNAKRMQRVKHQTVVKIRNSPTIKTEPQTASFVFVSYMCFKLK